MGEKGYYKKIHPGIKPVEKNNTGTREVFYWFLSCVSVDMLTLKSRTSLTFAGLRKDVFKRWSATRRVQTASGVFCNQQVSWIALVLASLWS